MATHANNHTASIEDRMRVGFLHSWRGDAMVLNKALTHGNLFGVSREMLRTALAVQPTREQLGEMIYRAVYEHQGGMWKANESQEVWFATADSAA